MWITCVFCLVVILSTYDVKGQGGANRGPIYFTYPNPFCQRNLIPHYPIREDWLMGTWKVLYQYQQSEKYDTECKKMEIRKPFPGLLSARLETTIREIITTEKHLNSSDRDNHTIVAYHEGPAIEGRYIVDKTDGLFTMSAEPATHGAALVFLGFTSVARNTPPTTEPYDTALYAVCSHLATVDDFGGSFVSEVGIMSKSGDISDLFLEHYGQLLKNDSIIEPDQLVPIDHSACPEIKVEPKNPGLEALLLKLKANQDSARAKAGMSKQPVTKIPVLTSTAESVLTSSTTPIPKMPLSTVRTTIMKTSNIAITTTKPTKPTTKKK